MKEGPPLLEVSDLTVHFRRQDGWLNAVNGVSFQIEEGETVALVGESGSGKSTVARAIVGLLRPSKGFIRYRGFSLTKPAHRPNRGLRIQVQMVFQDPSGSLDPRMRVGDALDEVLEVHRLPQHGSRKARVAELLSAVGLRPDAADQWPRQLSGGQRQRVAIARALAVEPKLLICDEPVSALDVSIRAQILRLLQNLQDEFDLAYLFITHDMAVVRQIADRVLVMYQGHLVETAGADELFRKPLHPYAQLLLASIPSIEASAHAPSLNPEAQEIVQETSGLGGCAFAPRCPFAAGPSFTEQPALQAAGSPDHLVACHHWEEIVKARQME